MVGENPLLSGSWPLELREPAVTIFAFGKPMMISTMRRDHNAPLSMNLPRFCLLGFFVIQSIERP